MTRSGVKHLISDITVAFVLDCAARRLAHGTVEFYSQLLKPFAEFMGSSSVLYIEDVTADDIRRWFLEMGKTRNPGGVHACWRAVKVFMRWFEREYEPPDWKNPIVKVKAPKLVNEPKEGVSLEHVQALLATCDKSIQGIRDTATFLVLLDTGLRMAELIALNTDDVDLETGAILVRHGKGGKWRRVWIGNRTRRELAKYLRKRGEAVPLFITKYGTRWTTDGLREMVRKRSAKAGIHAPGLHDFRRTFTIQALRNGADVLSLSRLLGHSTMSLVQRYARQTDADLESVHSRTSPVDNL